MTEASASNHIPLHQLLQEISRALGSGRSTFATAFLLSEAHHYLTILADPFDLSETRDRISAFEKAMNDWLGPEQAAALREEYLSREAKKG